MNPNVTLNYIYMLDFAFTTFCSRLSSRHDKTCCSPSAAPVVSTIRTGTRPQGTASFLVAGRMGKVWKSQVKHHETLKHCLQQINMICKLPAAPVKSLSPGFLNKSSIRCDTTKPPKMLTSEANLSLSSSKLKH